MTSATGWQKIRAFRFLFVAVSLLGMEGVGDVAKCREGFGKEVAVVLEALALKGPRKVRGIWPHGRIQTEERGASQPKQV